MNTEYIRINKFMIVAEKISQFTLRRSLNFMKECWKVSL